jgi:hypothetical protein
MSHDQRDLEVTYLRNLNFRSKFDIYVFISYMTFQERLVWIPLTNLLSPQKL